MTDPSETTSSRKHDHIRVNLEHDVRSELLTGLERYRFIHQALPEINLPDVDLTIHLFGKLLQAFRENEERAKACGFNTTMVKFFSLVLSAFYAGLAGSLYAHYVSYINPDAFTFGTSIDVLRALIPFGSRGSYRPLHCKQSKPFYLHCPWVDDPKGRGQESIISDAQETDEQAR